MDAITISKFLIKFRRKLFFLGTGFLLICVFSLFGTSIDGNFTGNIIEESEFYKTGVKIKNAFGLGNSIQIKVVPEGKISLEEFSNSLEILLRDIRAKFPQIKHSSILDFKTYFYLEGIDDDLDILKSFILLKKMPLVSELISNDGLSTQLLFQVDDKLDIRKLDRILSVKRKGIKAVTPFSVFHIEKSVSEFITLDLTVLSTIMNILAILVIYLCFKKVRYIFICIGFLGVGVLPSIFCFAIFNIKINVITILVIPILIVLTLSDIIHLMTGLRYGKGETILEKIEHSLVDYIVPSFITSLTTAVAFFSFSFSNIPNMKQFGIVSSSSVMLTFFTSFIIAPYLFEKVLAGHVLSSKKERENIYLNQFIDLLNRFRPLICGALVTGAVAGAFSFSELKFFTSSNIFFPEKSDLYQTHEVMNKDFNSILSLDILITPLKRRELPFDFKWDQTKMYKDIYALGRNIEHLDFVQKVSSYGNIVDYLNQNRISFEQWGKEKYLNSFSQISGDHHLIRVWFEKADDVKKVYPEVMSLISKYQNSFNSDVSSVVLLNSEVDHFLARNIFLSLISSGIIILLILYFLSNSVRVVLLCFFVNILPLSIIILLFRFFDLQLNIITAMSSIICLGIIVDDTIHIVYRWKNNGDLKQLSYGMLITSIILALGFGMFSFSQFEPSIILGIICGSTFILAAISDLTLLPWLLEKNKIK